MPHPIVALAADPVGNLAPDPLAVPRRRYADRTQATPVPRRLDEILPPDHLARHLWTTIGLFDLSAFEAQYTVVTGGPGRAPADIQILLTLWLYALSQGITSARAIADLCDYHLAYVWICGRVAINHHRLSDVFSHDQAALEGLFVQVIACLEQAGIVTMETVTQDGIRVRASAGAGSFHQDRTLTAHLADAEAHLAAVLAGTVPSPDAPPSKRAQAAQRRAARERVGRITAAVAALPAIIASQDLAQRRAAAKATAALAAGKTPKAAKPARASTTEPESRLMRMGDGGFRPAWNIQFGTDGASGVVIGVLVTNSGSDMGQALPLVQQLRAWYGKTPLVWMGDGGYPSHAMLEALTRQGCEVLAPLPKSTTDPTLPRATDSAAVAAWRARMATEEAKARYKLRAARSEWVNALARTRHGLQQLRVRGQAKVYSAALWIGLIESILRGLYLGGPAAFAAGGSR